MSYAKCKSQQIRVHLSNGALTAANLVIVSIKDDSIIDTNSLSCLLLPDRCLICSVTAEISERISGLLPSEFAWVTFSDFCCRLDDLVDAAVVAGGHEISFFKIYPTVKIRENFGKFCLSFKQAKSINTDLTTTAALRVSFVQAIFLIANH